MSRPCFTDFGYKNKEQLIHPKSVKYGRRTPMGIFLIRIYYVIWVAIVKAVFYFSPLKKTAVVGQWSMKVKNGKLFFQSCIKNDAGDYANHLEGQYEDLQVNDLYFWDKRSIVEHF